MRIAAIIPGCPEPADRGTYKRYRALIDHCSRCGTVDLVTLVDQDLAPGAVEKAASRVNRLHAPRVSFQPWKPLWKQVFDPFAPNVRHWYDPALVAGIRDFFQNNTYDMVVAGDLVSIPYVEAAGLDHLPIWIDRARVDIGFQRQRDAVAGLRGPRAWSAALRRMLTARYERKVAAQVAGTVVCAPSDASVLHTDIDVDMPIEVIANGIDREAFPDLGPLSDEHMVMIPGAMDYLPNVQGAPWFLEEVWPEVRARYPTAQCALVGRDPVPDIQAWNGRDGVQVTGSVPSMLPWYKRARCVAAPIHIGGGTRLKVVECWSVGRPLIGTTIAVDGLDANHGANCLIADDPDAFANAIADVLQNDRGAEALRSASLQTACKYDWSTVFKPLAQRWLKAS